MEKKIHFNGTEYLKVWLYLFFITSFAVTNIIKGTTPSFLLAFTCILIPLFAYGHKAKLFIYRFVSIVSIYFITTVLSQLLLFISPQLPSTTDLILISDGTGMILRNSLFTQSLYLLASFLIFIFVWTYYTPEHNRHLQISLIIFVTYGFYRWIFFLFFGIDGDFISNRAFGDDIVNPAQFQTLIVLGIRFSRFVSATGEASMYVFSVLPYCIYFAYRKSYTLTTFLLLSLVLTFSGSFIMGLGIWGISHLLLTQHRVKAIIFIAVVALIAMVLLPDEIVNYFIKEAVVDKINQESYSGIERGENFFNHLNYFIALPFLVKLFGLGFGVVRSTDMCSTLLVNTGIVGFITFTLLFVYPVYKLPTSNLGIRIALIVTYILMMVSVAEYAYPSLWLLLGIAYNQLSIIQKTH